ncbi:thiosulfate sulfurtransferase KNAG_0G02650 [Huiozyma naganishii CBS 8797]|uniref:Sulfurtransferase n=1 Tax=Huiozyma naganishii (strain ATCC MYA-139 / BCRC 22969 / CBS 8797 / KCTC 17520 / NBRC 10181 / NCYC 3082 / Yp74L-3) TaxID=1071383 RepID=J7S955_HUIN7|nr:hypothetical protein KNAG_0G02650 [Kazachstania naganishii CBS 8797]CCK71321.1 hypothetical protein KNAG_0G02650 [Kazachstania naganishii CBS 8797]
MLYKLLNGAEFGKLAEKCVQGGTRLVALDATWFMPNVARDAFEEFKMPGVRIPQSVFFDIDSVKDVESPFPHMAPSLAVFNEKMGQLGLRTDDTLVVYDRVGNFSSPRAAWTLALFGHKELYLLNNYNSYRAAGLPLEDTTMDSETRFPRTVYESQVDHTADQIVSYEQIVEHVRNEDFASGKINLFDARANPRFTAEAPEPRKEIPSGHVPGAQSLPFGGLLLQGPTGTEDQKLYPESPEETAKLVNETIAKFNNGAQLDPKKPTVCMCGTGITGCIIKTALEQMGLNDVKLYDGSWTEYALRSKNDPTLLARG